MPCEWLKTEDGTVIHVNRGRGGKKQICKFCGESIPDFEVKYLEEKGIVDKIWNQLGCFTYADATGKTIHDIIQELWNYRQKHSMEVWRNTCETDVYNELRDGKFKDILDMLFNQQISPGKAAEAIAMRANGVEPELPEVIEA